MAFEYTHPMTRKELNKYELPDSPGVYIFRGLRGKILYIGKAASLHDRVRSYFSPDLAAMRNSAIAGMVSDARAISWKKTDSVLEALILEANLIKQYQPPYNAREKDNKSFNYLVLTKEDFPRVLVVRGRELFGGSLRTKNLKPKTVFGPYPQGRSLADALKIVRRIFPFRDSCTPDSGKSCFNRQIGLCPGVCSGEINKTEYARTIRHIAELFSGNFMGLKRELAKEMRAAAKSEQFEKAEELRRQISALEHIRDVSLIRDESRVSSGGTGSTGITSRIEAYDVAHTAGAETVAVMTVIENGEAVKSDYRKFKIRTAKNDDIGALKEVLSRRLAHNEWPLPRVIAVDGGTAQVRAAGRVLKDVGVFIPVVGVVKNEFHKPERLTGDTRSIEEYGKDILLANSEAHRFAIEYHRLRRRASMI